MVVTTVSIRLALTKVCETTCRTRPSVIHVKALGDPRHRIFAVSIPCECMAEVVSYLTNYLPISVKADMMILTAEQAAELVKLALNPQVNRTAA